MKILLIVFLISFPLLAEIVEGVGYGLTKDAAIKSTLCFIPKLISSISLFVKSLIAFDLL